MLSISARKFRLGLIAMNIAMAAVLVMPVEATAAPEPEIVPSSWQLHFKWGAPGVISVDLPTQSAPLLYGYLPYTVTNKTGEDRLYAPDIWVWTDAGELLQANRKVPPTAFTALKSHLRNELLESPAKIVGRLLQGEDNARDGAIMWPVGQNDVDLLRVFVGGLSGETKQIPNPAGGDPIILRKTLSLEYETPGDKIHARMKPFILKGHKWVMR